MKKSILFFLIPLSFLFANDVSELVSALKSEKKIPLNNKLSNILKHYDSIPIEGDNEAPLPVVKNQANLSKTKQNQTKPEKQEKIKQTAQKRLCEKELIEAIEKNDATYFASKKGSLRALNDCIDEDGLTPMMMASYADKLKIVRLFLADKIDVNEKNSNDYNALHFGAFYGNYEIVSLLCDAGVHVNEATNAGQTALMIAAYYGNAKTVKVLLSKGANPNIKDFGGFSAKELAAKKRKKEVLAVFKEAGI